MKKLFIFTVIALSATIAQAQVRDLMIKKAGGLINKKETAPKDSTQNTGSSTQNNASNDAPMINFGMGSKKDIQAEYNFTANVYVQIQNYKKNGEKDGDASNVRYHFSNEEFFGTEMQYADKKGKVTESFGISEFKKGHIISLISEEGNKTGTVMKFDLQKQVDKANDTSEITVKKTGNTKKILGYNCEEYIMRDKDGNVTEYWSTKELNYDLAKMMAGDRSGKSNVQGYEGGFMMEMVYRQKNGEKTTWNVTEVNPTAAKKVVTGDYSFPY